MDHETGSSTRESGEGEAPVLSCPINDKANNNEQIEVSKIIRSVDDRELN